MSVVSDPEILKRLKQAEEGVSSKPASSSSGVVVDVNLKERLDKLSAQQIENNVQDTEESTVSSITEGSVFGDFFRTVASVGSSVVAEPLAGLAGIATLAGTAGDVERSAQAVESARESLTYRPETAGSQAALQAIGETLAPIAEGLETVSSATGDIVYEWTGSPELAAAAYSLPTAALEIAGIKGIRGGITRIKDADLRQAQKAMLTDPELKYSGSVAEVKLNNRGQLVEDKAGKKLVEAGIRPNDVSVITNSTPSTKSQMKEMVKIFEEGKGNDVLGMSNKTTKPIGTAVTNRLQALQSKRKLLGNRLESVVEGDIGKTPVDITDSLADINALLKSEGVVPVLKDGKMMLPNNWEQKTVFSTSTMAKSKKAIEDVYNLFDIKTNKGITSLKQAHKLKKNLDEFIDVSKLSEAGVSNNVIRNIAGMRQKINDSLSEVDSYGAVNKELSEIIVAMNPFSKYLKPGQQWSDAKVSAVVGEAMKTLASNSSSAVDLITDLSALEKMMRSRGMSFGDDPRALIQFRQTLLENFNVEPSLPASEAGRAVGGLVVSASVGNTFGAAHDASRLVAAGMRKRAAKKQADQNKKTFNMIKMAVNQ